MKSLFVSVDAVMCSVMQSNLERKYNIIISMYVYLESEAKFPTYSIINSSNHHDTAVFLLHYPQIVIKVRKICKRNPRDCVIA